MQDVLCEQAVLTVSASFPSFQHDVLVSFSFVVPSELTGRANAPKQNLNSIQCLVNEPSVLSQCSLGLHTMDGTTGRSVCVWHFCECVVSNVVTNRALFLWEGGRDVAMRANVYVRSHSSARAILPALLKEL